jgi:hypothetical protein
MLTGYSATLSNKWGMWMWGDVVAQWGCGGSVGMWWLSEDVLAQRGCGGSVWGCGGKVGMWWLRGDVVAQFAPELHQTATQQFRV